MPVPGSHEPGPPENTPHASGYSKVIPASATAGTPGIPLMTTISLPLPSLSEQESSNQPLL